MTTIKSTAPITVQCIVNCAIEKVWNYWTGAQHITQWNNASPDWHTPFAENDARTGGKFKFTMAARDGSVSFDFEGIYSEVKKHESIAYTLPDGRNVSVSFSKEGDAVKVVEVFDPENENPREMQQGGWQAILDNFKKYTEEN